MDLMKFLLQHMNKFFSHEQGEQIKKAYNEMLKIRATMLQEELLNLLN